ncbi:MAG TPA: hypothetical protein VFL91_00550, partial [Thermomicrobiales bacterium]|nr:hypothetical protein [Thermomicrobiales bacterium]
MAGTKTIRVRPGSELARLLDETGDEALLLEKDGVYYRLHRLAREDLLDEPAPYDAEAVRAALDATVGGWADLDADALIAGLYRARAEGSRPA